MKKKLNKIASCRVALLFFHFDYKCVFNHWVVFLLINQHQILIQVHMKVGWRCFLENGLLSHRRHTLQIDDTV